MRFRRHLRIILPLFGLCLVLSAVEIVSQTAGSVTVSPNQSVAGEFGTWTVTYQVGRQGIRRGGGIRVQLPDTWHAGNRNSANRLQATNPKADNYISGRSSRSSVRLRTIVESESADFLVKSARPGLDGRSERYIFVVRVEVVAGRLRRGDSLSVLYGDTSGGSRGMRAAIISTQPEPVLVAVDRDGGGDFELHSDPPTIVARSGPAAELLVSGPSTLVVGQPAELHLAVVDLLANPDASFEGEIQLQIAEGEADLPAHVQFQSQRGWETVKFTPRRAGILRFTATGLRRVLRAESNPIKVYDRAPERKLYWGDLHSHTHYSWDGVGSGSFDYARYVAALDFYAMADHSRTEREGFTRGLGPHVWEEYTALNDRYNDPGRFVALHAYEASFGSPYGHHNVYFRGEPGPLLAPGNITLPELWKALTAGEALTIPHHPGKFPRPVSWEFHDPELRRNIEIYSAHGLSEAYDPTHPLAFEQSNFAGPGRSAVGPQFAQDAWIAGLELSAIAASDDHRSRPGRPHWGLAAVRATGLTRAEIFDGLYQRLTYATTGARILLEFSINGSPMGEQVSVSSPPRLKIEAHGTAPIETLKVLRYSKTDRGFKVIYRIHPDSSDFFWHTNDNSFQEDSIYYVRLRQSGMVRDRISMAWSSPIWVKASDSP